MSIDRIGKTGSTSTARSKKTERKGDAAGFSKLLGGADEVEASGSAAAGGVGSVTGLDAILALQQDELRKKLLHHFFLMYLPFLLMHVELEQLPFHNLELLLQKKHFSLKKLHHRHYHS
mgnify:CR=1 FL=1